jgi:NAD(P)-dependent dehydrogenase (short-subunit alcohol dehydrogenase family)
VRPSFFFNAPESAPRTECACQPVACIISSMCAPSGRRRRSRMTSILVGVLAQACPASAVAAAEKEFGGADILINNAGTGSNETIMDAADDKWQFYWDLHVMAAVRLARGLVPSMRRRGGGVILNNASICAAQPLWYEPIYNVTKAALVMLSKTMATEFWIGAGFREVSAARIDVVWRYRSFDELWSSLLGGSTPSTLMLAALPAKEQETVRRRMLSRFHVAPPTVGLEIIAEALVVRGQA